MKNLPFTILICLALSLPPHPARAVDPATVAATAALVSSVVSLFDSGADVTAASVGQIRTMLETLHARLKHHEAAFLTVMQKLDDLPKIMREELERALDQNQAHALLAAIDLIVKDVRIIENGTMPITDPMRRLEELQHTSRNMMRRSDLNLPYVIAALRTERAFIMAVNISEKKKTGDWDIRKEAYRRRLGNTQLLIDQANALEQQVRRQIPDWMEPYQRRFRKLQIAPEQEQYYDLRSMGKGSKSVWEQIGAKEIGRTPRGCVYQSVPPVDKTMTHPTCMDFETRFSPTCKVEYDVTYANSEAQRMASALWAEVESNNPRQKIISEELMLFYRYMSDYARYTYDLLSGNEGQRPRGLEKRTRLTIEALRQFSVKAQEYADSFPRKRRVRRHFGVEYIVCLHDHRGLDPFGRPFDPTIQ